MLHIGWIPDTSYLTTEPGTETTFTMIHNASAEEMDLKPKRAKSLGAFQIFPGLVDTSSTLCSDVLIGCTAAALGISNAARVVPKCGSATPVSALSSTPFHC